MTDLDPAVPEVGATAARLARLEERLATLEAVTAAQASWQSDLQSEAARAREAATGATGAVRAHEAWLRDLERWVSSCVRTLSSLGGQPLPGQGPSSSSTLDPLAAVVSRLQVVTVMDWIAQMGELPWEPLVSVTLATCNRPALLEGAARSVLAQTYPHLELVIVDDSDVEEARAVADRLADDRIRIVRNLDHQGAGAAYNVGLDHATGDVVAFLDDDNVMHPGWLRSVVWALGAFPDVDAVYGARANEDPGAQRGVRSGMLPTLEFAPYDRARHELANFIDRNTIAFRGALRSIRYDPTLNAAFDWDHSLRLFAAKPPLALPALSCYYRTVLADRVSEIPDHAAAVARVRSRTHTSRPLRVLVHTEMYPVVCETYIGEDIAGLRAAGAEVEVTAVKVAASVAEGADPPRFDVERAIGDLRPDLALLHWVTHAEGALPLLEAHDLPFVCRVHSFDVDETRVTALRDHPLCVAILAHPHHVDRLPGTLPMLPAVGEGTVIPAPAARRDVVVSCSAGLPKKDFPLLIDAFSRVPEVERQIIVARSNGLEHVPDEVVAAAAVADPEISVRINVARSDVLATLARTAALVYTLDPRHDMGHPMSIIEAMLSGAVVIAPDRPEARTVVGPHLRPYRDAADIARHIREVLAGGPEIDAARADLMERAQRHRHPDERRRLHDLLSEQLTAWRTARLAS